MVRQNLVFFGVGGGGWQAQNEFRLDLDGAIPGVRRDPMLKDGNFRLCKLFQALRMRDNVLRVFKPARGWVNRFQAKRLCITPLFGQGNIGLMILWIKKAMILFVQMEFIPNRLDIMKLICSWWWQHPPPLKNKHKQSFCGSLAWLVTCFDHLSPLENPPDPYDRGRRWNISCVSSLVG